MVKQNPKQCCWIFITPVTKLFFQMYGVMYPLLTLNTKRTFKVQSKNKNHDVYSELEHLCYLKGKLVEMNFIVVHTFITFSRA